MYILLQGRRKQIDIGAAEGVGMGGGSPLPLTLRDRISGRVDQNNFTTETVFTDDEELGLVEHAEDSARLGYGFSNTALQQMAGEF
ncbi:hypothetical protein DPMN_107880 [Dreissena polymorpha]|uniref:Uncharacterized protein n=1 Tax=Dreissena polymorpha TaxID=45954 RepID=A0A9D4K7T6_DREPO|nr:hypothetical protein DPMN_107880 [Dreissena polymorpha]